MDYSVYKLLDIDLRSSPIDIMQKCQNYQARWTISAVEKKLRQTMSLEEAAVCAPETWKNGQRYLVSIATMLLDPSARQCYDAWLDVQQSPTPEKAALTKARLSWFNSSRQSSNVHFSESMINTVQGNLQTKKPPKRKLTSEPICRQCQCEFSFDSPYLVLHCDCTTRVGHVTCIESFSERVSHKCPVCRQRLLQRHQISKYLFWNVKEKFKFIA